MQLQDRKAGGVREGVVQDAGGEGIREVVEGEGEEAEDFLILLPRARHREQVARGIGRVDGRGDVVQVFTLFASFRPFWEMGVDIRHYKVHPFSSSSSSLFASCAIHVPVRIPVPYEYVSTIAQVSEPFVHLPLYKRRGTAGAGAEIDESVVGDGGAEDGLERAGDEGGGGCRLQDWGFVFPEEGETCLDEGAEGSGKPGLVVDFEKTEGWNG